MFWNKGRPTSMPSRRKNFVKMSFAPVCMATQPLAPYLLPACLRIHRRAKPTMASLMKGATTEGF